MREALGANTVLGYCTNVHPGTTLEEITANLESYAAAVRRLACPDEPLGVGLWIPARAARKLVASGETEAFGAWLRERELDVFTLNGFPYGDFHATRVKHRVYEPDWTDRARLAYTLDLIQIMLGVMRTGGEGSISTLPVGWRRDQTSPGADRIAASQLLIATHAAARCEASTGKLIHLDLEPEPGCRLQRSTDVADFFEQYLLRHGREEITRRHLRVCHDVCHGAVMHESQAEMLARYDALGILIGKVQISSAIRVPFDDLDEAGRRAALARLVRFGEERYLHQTTIRRTGGASEFHDDLPDALVTVPVGAAPTGEWRVHYHVPVYADRIDELDTTQGEIPTCLDLLRDRPEVRHFEVETYAWDVLPADLRETDVVASTARELQWVREHGGGDGSGAS